MRIWLQLGAMVLFIAWMLFQGWHLSGVSEDDLLVERIPPWVEKP